MEKLNRDVVPLKNVLGLVTDPSILDLLYEIVDFLDIEGRLDGVFTTKEVLAKTKVRVNEFVEDDIELLVSEGYISKAKGKSNGKYVLEKHPWDC